MLTILSSDQRLGLSEGARHNDKATAFANDSGRVNGDVILVSRHSFALELEPFDAYFHPELPFPP